MSMRMPSLAPWARVAYGVDWAGNRMLVVRATRQRGSIDWRDAPASGLPTAPDGEAGAAWSCGIAPGPGITTWLQTPLRDRRKSRKVLASVLDTRIPFPLEECVYAFSEPLSATQPDLPVWGEGSAALAVAIRGSDLAQQLALLEEKGIDPHVLDHEGLALWSGLPAGDHGVIRSILWPSGSALTCVFGMGAQYWGAQRIAGGAEAILREIRLLRHTQAGGRYKQAPMQWCFGAAVDASIQDALCKAEPGAVLALPDGEYYLARILAQRALRSGPLQFNLRRGPFVHTGEGRQQARRSVRQIVLLAACVVLLAAVNGLTARTRIHMERLVEQDLRSRARQVAGYVVQAAGRDALLIAEREHAVRLDALQPLALSARFPSLAEALAGDVATVGGLLHVLRLDTQSVRLEGRIPRPEDHQILVTRLTDAGYATEPPMMEQRPEGVRFTLVATRWEAP